MFRGHNPTEAEVQDMINETDTNNTGQVQWVLSLLNLYRIKAKNIYLDKREQVFFFFKYFIEWG